MACVDVCSQLVLWGEWVRVGLDRPRLSAVRHGDAPLGADFNEAQMAALDQVIASLGKPTVVFLLGYYSNGWAWSRRRVARGFICQRRVRRGCMSVWSMGWH